jgi:hypothetical protein
MTPDFNPYAAPQSEILNLIKDGDPSSSDPLSRLSHQELKRLYSDSQTFETSAFLYVIYGLLISLGFFMSLISKTSLEYRFLVIAFLLWFFAYVHVRRPAFGPPLVILASLLHLLFLPIGTMSGVFQLFAMRSYSRLARKNQFSSETLKAELKRRG